MSVTTADLIPVMKPWLGDEEARAAADAVSSGWVAQGPRVAAFEQAFAASVAAPHAVALSSCTAALHLGLVVAGVATGDEVIVPSFSFIATTNAVRYVAATPVFADVDLATGNLTAATVAAKLTARTAVVIVVHQGGMPADVAAIRDLVAGRGIVVLEDAACAVGATDHGRPVGAHAEVAAWSFHPRKVLTTGEGGMLTTGHEDWAARARRLREHGMNVSAADRHAHATEVIIERYLDFGFNYRMTDVQAAIGCVQLGKLATMVARRRELARRYRERLADLPALIPVAEPEGMRSNYQSFWVRLGADWPLSRDDTLRALAARGISARRGIMAAHLEPAYAGHAHDELPATTTLSERSLILPLFHTLREDQQDHVVASLRALARS